MKTAISLKFRVLSMELKSERLSFCGEAILVGHGVYLFLGGTKIMTKAVTKGLPVAMPSRDALLAEVSQGQAQGGARDRNQSAVRRIHFQDQHNRARNRQS
jgi:hypothetical protein